MYVIIGPVNDEKVVRSVPSTMSVVEALSYYVDAKSHIQVCLVLF